MKHIKKLRTLLPIMLILLGTSLLSGCIYIPTFGIPKDGTDFHKLIGDEQSNKPIRPHRITGAEIIRILGEPKRNQNEPGMIYYEYSSLTGVAIWPLCATVTPQNRFHTLYLHLDKDDNLTGYEIRD